MTSKDITEWHCNRCGAEAAIETRTKHEWCGISRPYFRYNQESRYDQLKPSAALEAIGGDICPDCLRSIMAWWHAPKQPAVPEKVE